MPANAFAAAILGDVHAVVPLVNIRRPDGSHGLVAQNRVQIVAQILLVLFLGGLAESARCSPCDAFPHSRLRTRWNSTLLPASALSVTSAGAHAFRSINRFASLSHASA